MSRKRQKSHPAICNVVKGQFRLSGSTAASQYLLASSSHDDWQNTVLSIKRVDFYVLQDNLCLKSRVVAKRTVYKVQTAGRQAGEIAGIAAALSIVSAQVSRH